MQNSKLDTGLRTLICCGRSGSTAVLHCLSQSDDVIAHYQPIKSSVRDAVRARLISGEEDEPGKYGENYEIFYGDTPKGKTRIMKETVGSYNTAECDYSVFPPADKDEAIISTKPAFLVRDPLEVMEAKKRRGWKSTLDNSARAYHKVFEEWQYAKTFDPQVLTFTYDHLMRDPEEVLQRLCTYWGIEYDPVMLNWVHKFPDKILGGQDFYELIASGSFDGISSSNTLRRKEYQGISMDISSIVQMTRGDLKFIYDDFEAMKEDAFTQFGSIDE